MSRRCELYQLATRRDNYAYLFRAHRRAAAAVIDPSDAEPVLRALEALGWGEVQTIVNTHHHDDHTGGNEGVRRATGAAVLGPAAEAHRIESGLDAGLVPGQAFELGGAQCAVLGTPGHTSGHLAFHVPQAGVVFCGDALFSLGCGRLFEGTAAEAHGALATLAALPHDTLVACGHEYTESNAAFAVAHDPDNDALRRRVREVAELRAQGLSTVPSSLGLELATNPFLRTREAAVCEAVGLGADADGSDVFAELRARKDAYA